PWCTTEEAMTNLTTPQTHRDQFVTDMMQRMATLARTLSDWVTSDPRTLEGMEQQVLRIIKDLGAALLAGLCQLSVPAYPSPTSLRDATERLGQVLTEREAEPLTTAQTTTTPPAPRVAAAPRMYISMDGMLLHIHDEGWKEVKLGAIYTTTSRVPRTRPDKLE